MAQGTPEQQRIIAEFKEMRAEMQSIAQKATELEEERTHHLSVIAALEPLEKDRVCHRLIGGVLVERTVGDVLPTVKQNLEQIELVLGKLQESYTKKSKSTQDFAAKHNISVRPAGEGPPGARQVMA